jgi:hypothetical protein
MKTFRKFCAALALTVALVLPVSAGDIQFPGAANSTSSALTEQQCTAGDIQFPGATSECAPQSEGEVALDPATEMMLTLLEGLISLF